MKRTPEKIIKDVADYAWNTRCEKSFQRNVIRCAGLDQLERVINDCEGSNIEVRDYARYLISKYYFGKNDE